MKKNINKIRLNAAMSELTDEISSSFDLSPVTASAEHNRFFPCDEKNKSDYKKCQKLKKINENES